MTVAIAVWLDKSSLPDTYEECIGYEKGSFYCVYSPTKDRVNKYPIDHIWRIEEAYPKELRREG